MQFCTLIFDHVFPSLWFMLLWFFCLLFDSSNLGQAAEEHRLCTSPSFMLS